MMKYIIELEDEPMVANTFFQEADELWKAKGFNSLVFDKYGLYKLTPYTEPDREAIENEVWEFATTCTKMDGADSVDVFGGFSLDSFTKYSYQEAKAKYDAWKKSKEEIHVGDEVKFGDTNGVVVGIDTATEDGGVNVVCRDGNTGYIGMAYVTKTGRHFPEIEELLKKMEED